jgi:hypothetical protein
MFDKKRSLWILVVGDVLALMLFVYLGQRDHETVDLVNPLLGILLLTGEFAIPWLIAGWWLGVFSDEAIQMKRTFFMRSLNAWLVAAPFGILLRALVLGRAVIPTPFFVVALSIGGAFVLGWRMVFAWVWVRHPAKSEQKVSRF